MYAALVSVNALLRRVVAGVDAIVGAIVAVVVVDDQQQ